MNILCFVLNAYLIALFARIILSWFPVSPGGAMAQIFSVLYSITEPVLGPIRRAIPPVVYAKRMKRSPFFVSSS